MSKATLNIALKSAGWSAISRQTEVYRTSNIQIAHVERVVFDELSTGFYSITH